MYDFLKGSKLELLGQHLMLIQLEIDSFGITHNLSISKNPQWKEFTEVFHQHKLYERIYCSDYRIYIALSQVLHCTEDMKDCLVH